MGGFRRTGSPGRPGGLASGANPGQPWAQPDGLNDEIASRYRQGRQRWVCFLSNWQNWSALLATLSSVVEVLTGFITRLSGWMIAFHKMVRNWLGLRRIYKRTYRSWEFRKDLQAVEAGLDQ